MKERQRKKRRKRRSDAQHEKEKAREAQHSRKRSKRRNNNTMPGQSAEQGGRQCSGQVNSEHNDARQEENNAGKD